MKKRLAVLGLALLFLFAVAACSGAKTVNAGRYETENGFSWVLLEEDGTFSFTRHMAMSYLPTGEYSVKNGKLILRAGADEEYVFSIAKDGLSFESGTSAGDILPKGTLFKPVK